MWYKKFLSLIGLLYLGNWILSVSAENCKVLSGTNCIANTYNLVDKNRNYALVDKGGQGTLFYCKGEPVTCSDIKVPGYYIVHKDKVFSCRSQQGEVLCQEDGVSETACDNASKIGKLFSPADSSSVSICLNYDADAAAGKKAIVVELNGSNGGNYLISKNADSAFNVFGISGSSDRYAIVTIKDKTVSLNADYDNHLRYVYALKETSRVMEKAEGLCPKDNNGLPEADAILEVSCAKGVCKEADAEVVISGVADGINVLKLNADGKPQALAATDLNKANIESFDLRMYYCASEVCNMINGYVLTNDGNSDIYYTITESGAAAVETDSEATCTKENIGEVITTDGSTFKICLDDDEALTVAKGRYILGDGVGKGPFASNTKKMIEVDDGGAHIYVVNDLKAENGKNYIVKLATDNYKVYKYDEGNDQFEWDTSLYGVKTYLEETGSTVLSEYVVTDTQSIEADADVADWRLFNCKEGSCKATYGYIKSPNEVEKFIRIPDPDTSATDNVITTFSTDCGSADTYKLKADGTLCIDGDASAPKTGEMIEGNAFLVTTIDDNASIFNKAASNIIVQVSGNYIYYNNYYQEEGPNLFSDLVKIPTRRIVGEDSELLAKLALYDCGEDSCTASGGYAINSNGYYAITNDPGTTATVAYEIEEAKDCTDKVGEILTIGTSNYLCLDAAIQAELINGLYFLKTDTTANKPLKGYNTKIIRISDNFISVDHTLEASEDTKYIIKNGDSYTLYTYDSDGQTFAEGSGVTSVALYQPIAGTNVYQLIADEDAEKVTTNSEITDWMIFDCKTGDCHQTYGYYTVGSDDTLKYFSIPYSGANTILRVADITPKECKKAGDIGNLVKDGEDIKLCVVNNSDTPVLSAFEAKDYILSIENANIFIGASASKSMIIHGTATSFTRNINAPYAVNNIDPATKEVVAADYMDESAQAKVAILKCSVDGCEKVDGYTESSGSYYQISKTTGSSASLVPETTTCSETNVGKIIDISGTKTLCLSNSNGIDVTKKGIYVMGTVANGTPLVSGKMIEIADSYIVVDDGLEGTTDAVYLIKIGTDYLAYKYTATTKTFSKVTTVSGMKLYQALEAGSNVYQEVSTTEGLTLLDLTTLELFQCDSGKCVPLTGNISVKGKIYENSTDPTKWTVVTEEGTCSVGNVGKLKLKENTSAIQICMGTGETPSYALALLTAGTWYFIANKPYLMNSDLTILVNPAAVPGAYLVNNDNEVVTSSATKLVVCTDGTTCASKTFAEAGIGYYKDSADATKSIQCTGTACAIDTTSYAACASGKVGLLDNDGKLCVDTTPAHAAAFAEDSTPVYYVVSYEAASASTNIFKAQASKEGDYALIKATEISITLSTDAKTGTCYKNNEVSSGNEGTADACTSASGTFLACTSGVCTAPAPAPAAGSGGG